jgi:GTPase KRas
MNRVVCWKFSIQPDKVRTRIPILSKLILDRGIHCITRSMDSVCFIFSRNTNQNRDGEGFLLVYSICSRSSFERVRKFQEQIHRVKDASLPNLTNPQKSSTSDPSYQHLSHIPLMLVGNKADRSTEREVSAQEGRSLAQELGCLFTESSAKTCQNVELAFYEVVRQIRRQRDGEKEQLLGKSKTRNGRGKPKNGRSGKSGRSCTIL